MSPKFVIFDTFLESAFKLEKHMAKKVLKALNLFATNQLHPGLNVENLRGNAAGLQSLRVDESYRIILEPLESTPKLLYVGPHEQAYRFAERFRGETLSAGARPPRGPIIFTSKLPLADLFPVDELEHLLLKTIRYAPITIHLRSIPAEQATTVLSFGDIERIIGRLLPASARLWRAWWSNDRSHVQAIGWLAAGWKVESVKLAERNVTFLRTSHTAAGAASTKS